MPSVHALALFSLATIALLIIPGPAVLFIVTRSVDQGRSAGLVSVAGIHCGTVLHVVAAAFGISALLAASQTAFDVVRYAGAAYLIVLGVRTLMRRIDADAAAPEGGAAAEDLLAGHGRQRPEPEDRAVHRRLPAAVRRSGARLGDGAGAGARRRSSSCSACCPTRTYALGAARAGARLRAWSRFGSVQRYASGAVYIGLGLAAALTGSRPQRS